MRSAVDTAEFADPAWRGRVGMTLLALVILWPLAVAGDFRPWSLFDAQSLNAAAMFVVGFFPPALDTGFLQLTLRSAWITIAIATAGMTLALAGAIPLALIATDRLSVSAIGRKGMSPAAYAVRHGVRAVLVVVRSVPELVLALVFVRVAGLGPTAGVLAIAITYCAMLAKVFAEIIESGDKAATLALLRNGSGRLAAFLYCTLPQCASELVSYLIYRWECAIRASVVMGFVGAGGLGQQMDASIKMMAGREVATMLIVFMLLVGAADLLSGAARRRLG